MNLRNVIKNILLENVESLEQDFQSFLQTVNFSGKGYNLLSVKTERYYGTGTDYEKLKHFIVTLQHIKPDFKRFIDDRAKQPGRMAAIYGDTPSSKTKITRWLTGYKEGSEIDARQKSAAIKIAQLTGLDAIQELVIDPFETQYPGVTVVANFTGAATKKKGLSFFEVYVFPPTAGSQIVAPIPPTEIPVDDEVVEIPREPVSPPAAKPAKKPKKPRNKRKTKMPKLTSKQRKAGYNRINQQGHIRHVLEQDELQDISDHIVEIVLGSGAKEQDELGPGDAADAYQFCRNATEVSGSPTGERMYRIVDDYYDNPLPRLVFYKCQVFEGGRIKSRSMMSQYTSRGSDQTEGFYADEDGEWTRGMGKNDKFAVDKEGIYTSPKLGGKEAKDARRYVNAHQANDELIIYALVSPRVNKYTSKPSIHTGSVTLYVFQLDRNFDEGE